MKKIDINQAYELYQIITDFHDSLEIFREAIQNAFDEDATEIWCTVSEQKKINSSDIIIDIINNGYGLPSSKVNHFFDLANSTKIDSNMMPLPGKIGYKGHGSKIFFNSKRVEVISKTNDEVWFSSVENPIDQLSCYNSIEYSIPAIPQSTHITLPDEWCQGFGVRIIAHNHFNSQYTKHKLNHENLRDYIKWYTVMGSVLQPLPNKKIPTLYLHGIDTNTFKNKYENKNNLIDPIPEFMSHNSKDYEKINFGHYFPSERYSENDMSDYAKSIQSSKAYYDYYSRKLIDDDIICTNGMKFRLILNLEGYETKRRYDTLLLGRGKTRTDISHTDSDRYGLWACKGGVPVEKIDSWIEGGKGSYTFIHGFLDCDDFTLTANRGSINNTPTEKTDIIKNKLKELFATKKFNDSINERTEIERFENQLQSIKEDGDNLKKRSTLAKQKKRIILPNGDVFFEPGKRSTGYSESETMVLLLQLVAKYPDLLSFKLLDYDTIKGIDFVVEHQSGPKYIELKGTLPYVLI